MLEAPDLPARPWTLLAREAISWVGLTLPLLPFYLHGVRLEAAAP